MYKRIKLGVQIMPQYDVKNLKTGETKQLNLTMANYEQWREDNPDWDRDWSQGCGSMGEVGDWRDKMTKTHPGWADIMKNKVQKQPKSRVRGW